MRAWKGGIGAKCCSIPRPSRARDLNLEGTSNLTRSLAEFLGCVNFALPSIIRRHFNATACKDALAGEESMANVLDVAVDKQDKGCLFATQSGRVPFKRLKKVARCQRVLIN